MHKANYALESIKFTLCLMGSCYNYIPFLSVSVFASLCNKNID